MNLSQRNWSFLILNILIMAIILPNLNAANLSTDTSRSSNSMSLMKSAAPMLVATPISASNTSYAGFSSRFGFMIPNDLSPYFIIGYANGGSTEFINIDMAARNIQFKYSLQVLTADTMDSVDSRYYSANWLYPGAGQGEQPHVIWDGSNLWIPVKNSWIEHWANGARVFDQNFNLIGGPANIAFPHSSTDVTFCVFDPNQFAPVSIPKNDPPKAQSQDPSGNDGDDVNVTNGNMFLSFNDYTVKGKGITTEKILRTYNSQSSYNGIFGYGWTFTYSESLKIESGKITYRNKYGSQWIYIQNSDGTFSSEAGDYSKLVQNGDNTYNLITKNGIVYSFNTEGKLISVADRNGNTTVVNYSDGILSSVTDSSGRSLQFSYGSNGKISSITDPATKVISYEYDSSGNLIKITDPAGGTTQYAYDGSHFLKTVTNANGASIHFTYDDQGRCIDTHQDNNIQAYSFVYHPESSITEMTDGNGHKTVFHYDAEKGVNLSITDAQGGVTAFTWDDKLNRTSITAPNGAVTKFIYDTNGNPLTITNPMSGVSTFTYEPKYNLVTSITNLMNQTTAFTYDGNGNVISTTDASGNSSLFTYDAYGNMLSTKNPNGAQTSYEYDASGYVIGLTNPLGKKSMMNYDTLGNLLSTTDANGNSTFFSYDALNRLIQVNYPDGTKTSYTYDAAGNRLSVTDQKGDKTTFAYDTGNRMVRKVDPTGAVTSYTYDSLDNVLTLTDPNSGTYQYTYNAIDKVVSSVSPMGTVTGYEYDFVGNVISRTDANGITAYYTYDLNNRLTKKSYAQPGPMLPQSIDSLRSVPSYPRNSDVTYTYDAIGNRTSMTDGIGTSVMSNL